MKKSLFIAAVLSLVAIAIGSCDTKEDEPSNPSGDISVSPSVLYFDAPGGKKQVEITCSVKWRAVTEDEWLWLEGDGSNILTVKADPGDKAEGSVVFTTSTSTFTLRVYRNAGNSGGGSNPTSDGLFSVSPTNKVRFSPGNLQYQASTNKWRFAENQYDMIGSYNQYISANYEYWIDLFGWGTSGWESGAVAYQPWSISTNDYDYHPGGSYENELIGDYREADWGVHNPISNGANAKDIWRTLTEKEWYYLYYTRNKNLCGRGSIIGTHGYIFLPDDWTLPSGVSFVPQAYKWDKNNYSLKEWEMMEKAGAIFLPCAGWRDGTEVQYVNEDGYYWASTRAPGWNEYNAAYWHWAETGESTGYYNRHYGMSVRLVTDMIDK